VRRTCVLVLGASRNLCPVHVTGVDITALKSAVARYVSFRVNGVDVRSDEQSEADGRFRVVGPLTAMLRWPVVESRYTWHWRYTS